MNEDYTLLQAKVVQLASDLEELQYSVTKKTGIGSNSVETRNVVTGISNLKDGTLSKLFPAGETISANDAVYLANNSYALSLAAASSQYLNKTDNASLSITGDMTIECWINVASIGALADEGIVRKNVAAGNQLAYQFYITESAGDWRIKLSISANGSAATIKFVTLVTPSTSTWYHFAVVYTAAAGTANFYVNGVPQGSQQTGLPTSIFDSTADFEVGRTAGLDYFDGSIDDLRIWNSTRTAAQILANYNVQLSTDTNLKGYWKFENDYSDTSGNSNTLTANNVPTFSTSVGFTPKVLAFKASASNVSTSNNFLGFAVDNVKVGDDLFVYILGDVPNFTGLTQGSLYYLSNTAGAIATTAGTVTRKVGIATSTTNLLQTNLW